MQLNKRKIDFLLRLTLSLVALIVCAFVLLSPYVVRTYESTSGTQVYLATNAVYAQKPTCAAGETLKEREVTRLGTSRTEYYCVKNGTDQIVPTQEQQAGQAKAEAEANSRGMGIIDYFTSGAFLISITGVLLAFSGWILNSSIEYFIVGMGEYLRSDTAMGKAIVESWTIIRDIINLTFVFGLIYLAFMTIAKADTGKLKHGIANILIGALLINFSIFFGKAIIDVANVTAIEIYEQMSTIAAPAAGGSGGQQTYNVGISGFFAGKLGIPTTINPIELLNSEAGTVDLGVKAGKFGFGFSIFVSLIFLVTSFVFIAGGILIAIRFIVLALLLILSPIAFAFAFLPKIHTEEWSRMWWDRIVAQALFAPAYLLLLYIAMNVANVSTLGGNSSVTEFFSGGAIGAFMNFVLIIGFLVGAIIVAKKMGAAGSSMAMKWGGKATFGATAFLGRQSFGRLGNWAAENDRLKDTASRKGVTGFMARRGLGAARVAQKGSYDVRGIGPLNDFAKKLGLDAGKAHTGGRKQMVDDAKKKEKEYADSLGTIEDTDPRVMGLERLTEVEEEKLQRLQNEKQAAQARGDATEMNKLDKDIHAQEKVVKGSKEAVEREKNRRQVGVAIPPVEIDELSRKNSEFAQTRAELDENKQNLKDWKNTFANDRSTDAQRKEALRHIKEAQENIERLEIEQEAALDKLARGKNVGYAGVIGSSGHFYSAIQGRTRAMNREIGKAIHDSKKSKKKEKKEKPKAEKPKADAHDESGDADAGGHGGH